MSKDIKAFCQPDSKGFFGAYGGQYVPDAIKARLDELDQAFKEALADPEFTQEMQRLLLHSRWPLSRILRTICRE